MANENQIELRLVLERWKAVREHWDLNSEEEGSLLMGSGFSGPVEYVHSWGAATMERRMRLLIDLSGALSSLFNDEERVRKWLRRPLDSASGRNPIQAMSTSTEWIRTLKRGALDFIS